MKIYIDVGHGATGEDTGTTGTLNGVLYRENECNLKIALAAMDALVKAGHTVTMSRTENKNITPLIGNYGQADSNLIASANYAKAGNYDLMVSIHNNAGSASARGHQLFYKTGDGREAESKKLANAISGKLATVVAKNSVGTKIGASGADYYGILRLHDKIGVLCECAFMSNASDLAILATKTAEIGAAIADGINSYLGVKAQENKPATQIYRVRKTWADAASQIGAYEVLENAKKAADAHPGYYVFDESGTAIYQSAQPKPTPTEPDYKSLYNKLLTEHETLKEHYADLESKITKAIEILK